ncbi:acetylajmalan esterase [Phtheirospermum japonicum]|uniref:Acetylajmalan esterase n=1 Tax=Phtheirospermum japonicum TaxID=374723 RepID=A0A830CBM7_9LAMI|nr:acetylajmalan esterase [Phtheirospermum japonicum]
MGLASFFCFIISFSVSILTTSVACRIICPFQSLYQLGDSTSDTGNLVRVSPVGPFLPAARLPYGETFPGRPTGRWSDGRLIIDFTATALGLPMLEPYQNKNASFKNGVNFAVAGATALNASFFSSRGITVPASVGSLDVQLSLFRTYLSSICSTPSDCADKLRRALIFVGEIGGNDINYPLAQGRSLQEIQTYVPFINQAIVNATREIILTGALQIVVPGNFPIGCIPFALNAFASNDSTAYDEIGCIRSLNNLAIYQNNNLQVALNSLRREFPSVDILYADYYNAFLTILRQAPILGFDRRTLLKPCCRSGEFNPVSPQFCGGPGVPVCNDPNRYIHWDGLHLTEAAHRRISSIIVRNILLRIKCIKYT